MQMLKSGLPILGLMFMAFCQSACTKNDQSGDTQNTAATAQDPSAPKITRAQAERKALEKIPDSFLISGELELEDGKQAYSIEARTPRAVYEVVIDAMTGDVLETDDNTMDFREDSLEGKAPLSLVNLAERDAAEQVALQAYPGEAQEWKAVTDSSRAAFSFKIQTGAGFKKVVVAAGTNEILKVK